MKTADHMARITDQIMTAKTDFKITPEENELETIERDLRFHPTENPSPRVLSSDQIARFNRDGFIQGIRIFSDGEIGEIRAYFDALLARVIAAGGDSYSISTAHAKYARVYDILTDRRIVACVGTPVFVSPMDWMCEPQILQKTRLTVEEHQRRTVANVRYPISVLFGS